MKSKDIVLISFLISSLFISCSKKEVKKPAPSYPVKVKEVIKKEVPIYIDNIGHVDPIVTIDIKARVEGELMEINFIEGKEVQANDLLFIIDPRPYEKALEKSKSVLEENLANLYIAKDKFMRYSSLVKQEYISELNFEEIAAQVAGGEALIKQNQTEIEDAKLNLSYCTIRAPISGMPGILKTDLGNMIYPNSQTPLVTLNQMAPIYVVFYVPEKELPRVQKYAREKDLTVRVAFEDLDNKYIEGKLNLIDNEVDMKTGQIRLRAIFDNKERILWPGKFVKTRLILKTDPDALIIPFQAVQITSTGPKVFIVKEDERAELRDVVLGQREGLDVIIKKGVSENEKVVIEGQFNLADGTKIFIKEDK